MWDIAGSPVSLAPTSPQRTLITVIRPSLASGHELLKLHHDTLQQERKELARRSPHPDFPQPFSLLGSCNIMASHHFSSSFGSGGCLSGPRAWVRACVRARACVHVSRFICLGASMGVPFTWSQSRV